MMVQFADLHNLIHTDLVDCIESDRMKLHLQFRIHRETNEAAYKELIGARTEPAIIQDNDKFPLLKIEFNSYIGYAVRNESFTVWDDYEQFEGKIFRVYQRSRYLDFISKSTIATADYPGPFLHYGIAGLNHIVDIVSTEAPVVKL